MQYQKSLTPFMLALFIAVGCGQKEDDDEETTPQTLGDIRSSGSSGGSSDSLEVQQLTSVRDTMVPGSLESSGASLQDNGDPCADSDGFFDCQPELLKLYVGISKQTVSLVTTIYKGLDEAVLPNLPVGNGTIDINEDDEDIKTLHYNITDAENYEILAETDVGPVLHFRVVRDDAGVASYTLRWDGSASSDDDNGIAEIDITYASATDFSVDVDMTGQECDAEDIRAPQTLNIRSAFNETVWQGKAQLYMPLWLFGDSDNVTCETEPTDSTKMFYYTDFVGTDENTTASIYLADKNLTEVAGFADHEAADFCVNHDSYCAGGFGFGDSNPVASYANPFCVSDSDTVWDSACTDLGVDQYTSTDEWLLPTALEATAVTFPTEL